ncbi:MAG: 50S ribosomal protein L9 [Candidatus Omnitrophica bacterium]|nr:50S ribosomal protein L9 [Candidatus Omnitrophota bacterium]
MKVILLREVNKLGKEGDLVEVKSGYARNYLIPYGFAIEATPSNVKRLERIKEERLKLENIALKRALEIKERLEKLSITLTAKSKDDEEIYGSLNETHILNALKDEGIDTDNLKIFLDEPIRKLGAYTVNVKLHPKVNANLRLWVVRK